MTAQKGSAFLLKISNGASPAVYQTVAGLRTTFPTGHFAIRQRGDHALSRPLHIDLPAP